MSQNISLWGATYSDVPSVLLPKSGGGTASFTDVTDTTATASDVLSGKWLHLADGSFVQGTNAGGSGDGYVWQDGNGYVHLSDEQGTQPIVDSLTVDASGTYTAQTGHVYNPVIVPSGTAGTPSASKGTVSNHSVTVTPSVTNSTGWITGSTKTGTAVTVSASELVSGTYSVTSSGTKDVTNYASASVPAGTEGTPTATKGTVSNHSVTVTPSVTNTGGYITGSTKTGTAVTVSASELDSGTKSITANGTNIDVVGYASVDVAVPSGSATLITKSITQNGTYNASSDNADGYSSVTVNVSGGSTTLKMGVLRPDATLVQTWSYDKLIVQDEGITLPAYTTTATTLITSAKLTGESLDVANYDYYALERHLATNIYATGTTTGAGMAVYGCVAKCTEWTVVPYSDFASGATSNYTLASSSTATGMVYYNSSGIISGYNSNSYGGHTSSGNSTWSTTTFTPWSPNLRIRGNSTYFNQTYWNALEDIRYQYKFELYRVPKNSLNLDGFNLRTHLEHVVSCANSANGTLT